MAGVGIFEVSPRDGLQNEAVVLPLETRLELVRQLVAAGFHDIEVASFVRSDRVPQMAEAEDMIRRLPPSDGVRYWSLIPNPRGLERALGADAGHLAFLISASASHNQRNVGRTIEQSLGELAEMFRMAGPRPIRGYISMAFGCPIEGAVDPERVKDIAEMYWEAGVQHVVLSDTIGCARPDEVVRVVEHVCAERARLGALALHLHDTCGLASASVWAAHQAGVRTFDAALSGVGGCPFALGAAGNVCTQDLLVLLSEDEVPSGIDLEAASRAGAWLEQALGRPLPGRYHRYWLGSRTRPSRST